MEIWNATKLAFKNFATFAGTTSRADYWYFILAIVLGSAITSVLSDDLVALFGIVVLVPWLSASARRLRDAGKPLGNFAWLLLPVVGLIVFAIQTAQPTMPDHQRGF